MEFWRRAGTAADKSLPPPDALAAAETNVAAVATARLASVSRRRRRRVSARRSIAINNDKYSKHIILSFAGI